jgi:ElaB/YqjD/DUF883 family membrane-anchored ribosome-binding protein
MSETNRAGDPTADSADGNEPDDLAALRERIVGLQDEMAETDKQLRALVRDRPLAALVAAALAGFVLGRIIGRS